jgi:cytochrome c-type biogenesis protein CcmH/NrfF
VRPLAVAFLIALATPAFADSNLPPSYWAYRQLPDAQQEAKAQELMQEIRCLVCQGQSIADSDAELAGDMRDGFYEVPEGATVTTLMDAAQREAGRTLSEEIKKSFVFLANSKPAQWETVLKDGDKVRVLYKILGG